MQASLLNEDEFPKADRDRWLALVAKTLGEARFEDALVSQTDDGLRIDPIYERAEGFNPLLRADPSRPWTIVQRVDDVDPVRANQQALQDIEGGATGLAIVFEGAPNAFGYGLPASAAALSAALDGVPLARMHVRVDLHPQSRVSVDWLVHLFRTRKVDPTKLDISFGIDPAAIFAGTGRLRMSIEAMHASMPQSLAHYFALGLPGILMEADGRVFHNAGATEAQELGAMVASAVSYLRMFEDARQPLVYAAPHIGFAVAVDQDQFLSMAKLRAIRLLWARVLEACSVEPLPATIHAETSWRMLAYKDPETNILRNTIACFAAATGGADTISVLPHTLSHGLPDPFARRVARNIQLVLAGESRIGFVSDPAAGSGAIEALTGSLCDAAWEEFRRIEAEGGILPSVSAGKLQARIREAQEARAAKVAAGERVIVGTNLYPAPQERVTSTLSAERRPDPMEGTIFCEQLALARIDEAAGGQA